MTPAIARQMPFTSPDLSWVCPVVLIGLLDLALAIGGLVWVWS